jgi:hypothetical protein
MKVKIEYNCFILTWFVNGLGFTGTAGFFKGRGVGEGIGEGNDGGKDGGKDGGEEDVDPIVNENVIFCVPPHTTVSASGCVPSQIPW